MPGPPADKRPPVAAAMAWAAQITQLGLELAVPVLLGHWLDGKWGTAPVLVIVGALLGILTATLHFIQMVKRLNKPPENHGDRRNP